MFVSSAYILGKPSFKQFDESLIKIKNKRGLIIEPENLNEGLTHEVDAHALLGNTNYELSLRRREMVKRLLSKF